tara:strand:+ start:499 stop:876 length:378 start_codon:yes stop_codon:yes gene_type:complete
MIEKLPEIILNNTSDGLFALLIVLILKNKYYSKKEVDQKIKDIKNTAHKNINVLKKDTNSNIKGIEKHQAVIEKNLREYVSVQAKTNGQITHLQKDSHRIYNAVDKLSDQLSVMNKEVISRLSYR